MGFDEDKLKVLSKKDKSWKGSWDLRIRNLCDKINYRNEYYTTSSCSGRIVLVKDGIKKAGMILFSSHEKICVEELKEILEELYEELVWLRMEGCALHVCCRDLNAAFSLLRKARECGWKRSGLMSDKRIICELFSTENLAMPFNKKILIDDNYVRLVVNEVNKKLERTWDKISKLEKGI